MAKLTVVRQPPTRRERKEAEEALGETTEAFLDCRDLHHPWQVVGCYYVGSEVHRKLLCPRCETEATDVWTGRGERIQRKYKYVQGYQVKGVRITPIAVRREVLKRVSNQGQLFDSEEQLMQSLFTRSGSRRKRA